MQKISAKKEISSGDGVSSVHHEQRLKRDTLLESWPLGAPSGLQPGPRKAGGPQGPRIGLGFGPSVQKGGEQLLREPQPRRSPRHEALAAGRPALGSSAAPSQAIYIHKTQLGSLFGSPVPNILAEEDLKKNNLLYIN